MRLWGTVTVVLLAASPAHAQTFATFACADGTVIPVQFFDLPRSASVQIDGKALILPQRLFSMSGARYSKAGITLHISRKSITLKRKGQRAVPCVAQ